MNNLPEDSYILYKAGIKLSFELDPPTSHSVLTHPNNSHSTNRCRLYLHVPDHPPWPLHAHRRDIFSNPSLTPTQTHLLRNLYTPRTAYPRGDSATLRSPGNRLLWLCLGEGSRRTLGLPQGKPAELPFTYPAVRSSGYDRG